MIDLIFAKKPHKTVSEIDYVALYGSYARFRPTGTGAFILVVHNWEKFVEVAGRNHDVAWVLGRSILVNLVGLVD